jgi:RNA polymerase sigma-70 factor (ECF subfamily)
VDARELVACWDAYAQQIHRYCFRRTGDAALAEDLTSVVFLEAWRRRRDVTPSAAWLYGIATNVLRNQQRSRRRYEAALARLPRPQPEPDFAETLAERVSAEQEMRLILGRLEALHPLERDALALCVWEGLSTREAAEALDVPEGTVRTRLHRARVHLARLLPELIAAKGDLR